MSEPKSLLEAYKQAAYPVGGHGPRTASVLQEAFRDTDPQLPSDMYGSGAVIEDFQAEMAQLLGKESAVFFPSGTMAQQIALRIWCDRAELPRVAYHPLSHLEIHEQDGLKKLHRIETVLLADKDRLITLEDVQNMEGEVACLLLELPQREIGGQLPDYAELTSISQWCRERGIRLHLDGARLFEIVPHYGVSASDICALFDSVYVSLYKGIGGVAGAVLAGDTDFTEESKVWKRRHGGDLISLYPYIVSGAHYMTERLERMGQYYNHAIELAAMLTPCPNVRIRPERPVSNMFHLHFQAAKAEVEPLLVQLYAETDIALTSYLKETGEHSCYCEISLGDQYGRIPAEKLEQAVARMGELTAELG